MAEHLKKHGVNVPFMIQFSGRKHRKNKAVFHTFVGRDALTLWKEYFDRVRGWPKEGEAGVLDRDGNPISKVATSNRHLRVLEKLSYVKRGGDTSKRYGYNLHEFRDEAKTYLHLKAKKDGLDMDAVDYWMGHDIDPNKYDKFNRDHKYLLEHFRIAEQYLNVVSNQAADQARQDNS